MPRRPQPLSRERVLEAAIRVADRGGAEAITIRRVAQETGVEAMSLYHHVPNKDAILDGVVDAVCAAIELPGADEDWRDAIRARAHSARTILSRHSWALGLMDSRRNPGPTTLRHHDAVLGVLRRAGFTLPMAAHAVSLIDSYIGGYVLQEANLPVRTPAEVETVAAGILDQLPPDELPNLREMIVDHALRPGYDHTTEFAYGLDLILDALEARRK
ncbi:TetR/AcrR family transcriptional regulator [Nocardia seriolae]|uniref:TetR/AcrR family transcriptional regulator n=1 Tax=Nocardia seriolae TaxID=37332 RepID=UPI000519F0D7|nr:TetR/AcrR family transcriptional regulator C-terminal domain-containing protein [Nocardia seriolae]MTJ62968.1 TetR family transcriptional regulator [Nocardia seriolae]MTJ73711.1 TetR family transcriptional regulator [Nocardia seriolae]MTJ87996.1 TetR family transcriptional regulator [Nocardia seriolae]MTK31986.1 TetR family transcriptional regulator [Nocardia seriolae]MTK40901.1 TetR family transcriptional regulator [Nocardia seriolae]